VHDLGASNLTITVLFFAQAREHAGLSSTTLELPDPSRVSDALAALGVAHPSLERLWPHLAVALDGQLVGRETPIHAGAELALLPPVSGG
jgi:molybdopterin synthase catalytic subunit